MSAEIGVGEDRRSPDTYRTMELIVPGNVDDPPPDSEPYRSDSPATVEIASGGVVYDPSSGEVLVLHVRHQNRWGFPKGHIEPGESAMMAAQREITEETGLSELEFERELLEVHYRFYDPRRQVNVFKTVLYWKVRSRSRDVRLEETFDRSRWVKPNEARTLMRFASDSAVIDEFLASTGPERSR